MSDFNAANERPWGRRLWLQLHRWIGLLLLILLIPVSVSGSLLVWDHWTDGWINPQRYAVSGEAAARPLSDYVVRARTVLDPADRVASVAFPAGGGGPVVVTASAPAANGGPPPPRTQVWLHPANARLLDHADMDSGLIRVLHRFHGSMMMAEWGRPIVGWLGVAMLISVLTGLWLWLPVTGGLKRGFRWNRAPSLSGRLHHQFGFWIALPLAILSFTGAYISFPNAMRSVEGMFASSGPARGGPPAPGGGRAAPAAESRLDPDEALAAASAKLNGAQPISFRWPTERAAEWSLTVEKGGIRRDIIVDDETGETRANPPQTTAARFMRTLHDGTGYNPVWQVIIFVGGLVPALLGITGLMMWLRGRRVKRRVAGGPPVPAT